MSVFLRQGSVLTEIGPGGILHSLFSTIAVRLEGGFWGMRFPLLMERLYSGQLRAVDAAAALTEIASIKRELAALPPSQVVWDAENPKACPPWGGTVRTHVRSCADYWVTASGRNLIDELTDNLESLKEFGGTLDVLSQPPARVST